MFGPTTAAQHELHWLSRWNENSRRLDAVVRDLDVENEVANRRILRRGHTGAVQEEHPGPDPARQ
jgi:hypothetical protein